MPDFLVIGAPKAGTTALHAALSEHPALYMSAIKEPKFFLSDGRTTRPCSPRLRPGRCGANRRRSTCTTRPRCAGSATRSRRPG
jgi:hypothetical protein